VDVVVRKVVRQMVVAVVVQAVVLVVPAGKCKLLHQRCRIRSIQTLLYIKTPRTEL
jgi:hypothetical protein